MYTVSRCAVSRCTRRGSPDCLHTPAACLTASFPPASGLVTCPSVAEVARSGDLATTWSVMVRTPGNDPRAVHEDSTYGGKPPPPMDRKSTRLNSSHVRISYAVF